MSKRKFAMWVNDLHVPYHDPKAWSVVCKVASLLQPTHIFLNGDMIDFYQLSRFDRDPRRMKELQDDLDELFRCLLALRKAAPRAKIAYRKGNHEDRLKRFLWKTPELESLTCLGYEQLFRLKELKIEWSDQRRPIEFQGHLTTHGTYVRNQPGQSARAELERTGQSGFSGHTHRLAAYPRTLGTGLQWWYECGCLCSLEPDYMACPNWQQGFAVAEYATGNAGLDVTLVSVHEGRANWRGVEVHG